ncbi:MAG TPA: alanine racemase [Candidatus Paceibacterota bacterium]|nr:alanine racemase [Candidatus Paceibacterota bacterium]
MRVLNFLRRFKSLFEDPEARLLRIEIDSQNLLHNISQFRRKFPQHQLAAVLKSNAYGHGLKEIGSFLDDVDEISYFAVDSLMEAQLLRQAGVRKKIIILGYVAEKSLTAIKKLKKVILVVNSLAQVETLGKRINFPLEVHLKVDTGMHRHGLAILELEPAIEKLAENKKIRINGLMTHLADANNPEEKNTLAQLNEWGAAVKIFEKYFPQGTLHFAATAGTRYLNKAKSNLIRLGIGLYGHENRDDAATMNLKPVLSLFAKIVNLREIPKGEGVGYNFLFQADKNMKIAVIPCGYYEAVPKALGNSGFVYYRNTPLRLLGRTSMNLSIIDVSAVTEPLTLETEIEVISSNPVKLNSVENYAKISKLAPYEIYIHLAPTIKRYIV